jgi:hypothetical protein
MLRKRKILLVSISQNELPSKVQGSEEQCTDDLFFRVMQMPLFKDFFSPILLEMYTVSIQYVLYAVLLFNHRMGLRTSMITSVPKWVKGDLQLV